MSVLEDTGTLVYCQLSMFGTTLLQDPIYFFLWALAIVLGISVHEFSHALLAYWQGDRTAEDAGRLTLNPLKHIDIFGFLMFLFVGFGWAKPTPFNPYNLKFKRFGPVFVALAGPIANVLFAVVIALVLRALDAFTTLSVDNLMVMFFFLLVQVNLIMAIFNLIPVPPLDGSKVLYAFIIEKHPNAVIWLERYGMFLLLALVIFFDGPLSRLISTIYYGMFNLLF